ncbi:NAD(P)(+)--arginine ADP-ribosyltransferase 2-like [Anableps anableps]
MHCPTQLDMAPDSVDDMYSGCEDEMERQVKEKFLLTENSKSKNFQPAWDKAKNYYYNNWATTSTLKKEEIMAIHAYTLAEPKLYSDFNAAVRTQKSEYATSFPYHTLHFYLTMALRSLKPKAKKCVTTYRRANYKFQTAINRKFRFGAFTSSSSGSYPPPEFGEKSCFEIYTCFGADISRFSKFESENEVLIPPYEVFKVTDIKERSKQNNLPCEVVYKVQSTKTKCSNLNCALIVNAGFN